MGANYPKAVMAGGLERLYRTWCKMRERCSNPNCDSYENYGGRGIEVCIEWASFDAFKGWALTNGYTDDLTIERCDGAKGYEPANCTWATRAEQNANRRNVARNAEGVPYFEVADAHGVKRSVYYNRVSIGWPRDLAATVPNKGKRDGARTRLADYLSEDGLIHHREAS